MNTLKRPLSSWVEAAKTGDWKKPWYRFASVHVQWSCHRLEPFDKGWDFSFGNSNELSNVPSSFLYLSLFPPSPFSPVQNSFVIGASPPMFSHLCFLSLFSVTFITHLSYIEECKARFILLPRGLPSRHWLKLFSYSNVAIAIISAFKWCSETSLPGRATIKLA